MIACLFPSPPLALQSGAGIVPLYPATATGVVVVDRGPRNCRTCIWDLGPWCGTPVAETGAVGWSGLLIFAEACF